MFFGVFRVEEQQPRLIQAIVPSVTLDHYPIVLESGGEGRRPTLFRFELMWFEGPSFIGKVGEWWSSYCAGFTFASNLKALKEKIKTRNT